ncbi:MAG: hypothetical protein AB7G39_13100 [Alphaproteobacteria bacterium]
MSDIAGIGSFQVGSNRSIPPQAQNAQADQQQDADLSQQRVEDRTTVGTDNNARGFDSSQSGAGSDNLDSSGAGSEPQDQITISSAAQQQIDRSGDSDTAPGEDGRQQLEEARESARDIALGRSDEQTQGGGSVSFGNAASGQSPQGQTLGQVVDIYA